MKKVAIVSILMIVSTVLSLLVGCSDIGTGSDIKQTTDVPSLPGNSTEDMERQYLYFEDLLPYSTDFVEALFCLFAKNKPEGHCINFLSKKIFLTEASETI